MVNHPHVPVVYNNIEAINAAQQIDNMVNAEKVVTAWDLLDYLMVRGDINGYDCDRLFVCNNLNGNNMIEVCEDDEVSSDEIYFVVDNRVFPIIELQDVFTFNDAEFDNEDND